MDRRRGIRDRRGRTRDRRKDSMDYRKGNIMDRDRASRRRCTNSSTGR